MKWTIHYSDEALKFAEKENTFDEVRQEIKKLVLRFKGQDINIDLKKINGRLDRILQNKKRKTKNNLYY